MAPGTKPHHWTAHTHWPPLACSVFVPSLLEDGNLQAEIPQHGTRCLEVSKYWVSFPEDSGPTLLYSGLSFVICIMGALIPKIFNTVEKAYLSPCQVI